MALLRPPHLKAMMCNKGGFWNAHTSGVRQGGAYEARQWVWGVKNASRKEPRMRDALEHIEKTFDGWMRRYPFVRGSSPLSITPEYENYIFDQAEQSDYNDYWKQIGLNTEEYVDQFADIPALFLSGWYDIYARSTIDFFTHLQPRKKGPMLLIMGPWQHVGAEGHVAGEVDFGVNALVSGNLAPNMFSLSRRWFDRWVDPASQPQPRRMTAQEKLALAIQVAEEQQQKKEKGDTATGEEPSPGGGSSGLERGSSGVSPSHNNNRYNSSSSGAASPSSLMVTTHPRGPYTSLSHISGSTPSHSPPPLTLTSGPSLYIPPSMAPRQHMEPILPLPPAVRYFRMGGGDGHKTSQGNMFHGGVWMQAASWPPAATRNINYYLTRRGLEAREDEQKETERNNSGGGGGSGANRRSGGTRASGGERRGEGAVERGRIGDKREAWTVDRVDADTTPHDQQISTSSSGSGDALSVSLPSPTTLTPSNSSSSLSTTLASLSLTSQPFTPAFPPADILHRLDHSTTFPYDPRNPCPTIGGNLFGYRNILVAGAYDQHERADMFLCSPPFLPLSSRRDVIVFRTQPLQQRLDITGTPVCVLYVSSTAVDTDFTVKLIDEYPPSMDYPHGFAMQVTHGIQRMKYRESREKATLMEPGKVYRVEVTMYPTSNLFSKVSDTPQQPLLQHALCRRVNSSYCVGVGVCGCAGTLSEARYQQQQLPSLRREHEHGRRVRVASLRHRREYRLSHCSLPFRTRAARSDSHWSPSQSAHG